MKFRPAFLFYACSMILTGCNSSAFPSIEALKADETLIMKYRSCARGCRNAVIEFSSDKAIFKDYHLRLSKEEIVDLDSYFKLGKSLKARQECSEVIHISFELIRSSRTTKIKRKQMYPCVSWPNKITPRKLVLHFNSFPQEIPFWKLTRDEYNQIRQRNQNKN